MAIDLTKPSGRVLGVDVIPAQPPKGVSTIQGDFLSLDVQNDIKAFLRDPDRGRLRRPLTFGDPAEESAGAISRHVLEEVERGYVDLERQATAEGGEEEHDDKCVDVVLSDMSAPWDLINGLYKKSISNPYYRMMNTSGNAFRDHAGSMVSHGDASEYHPSPVLTDLRIFADQPCISASIR